MHIYILKLESSWVFNSVWKFYLSMYGYDICVEFQRYSLKFQTEHLEFERVPLKLSWWIGPLQRRHNGRDGISNYQPHLCLLNRLFRRRSKKTLKLRNWPLSGNSPVTGEFPVQRASNTESVSIWWHHHDHVIMTLDGVCSRYDTKTSQPVIVWLIVTWWCHIASEFLVNINSANGLSPIWL